MVDQNKDGSFAALAANTSSDSPGLVSINDVRFLEGSRSSAVFTVTRTGGTAAFSVNYTTADGTAAAGSDYTATSGVLNFAAGQNTATIAVAVGSDSLFEGDETFFVNLTNATNNAVISYGQGVATLLNDDPTPPGSVSISDATVAEGDSGTRNAVFTVTRTGGTTPFTINYYTSDGSAWAGSDYVSTRGVLSFATGQTSATISVPVNGDSNYESDEDFFVGLVAYPGGPLIVTKDLGKGTIRNDDAAAAGSIAIYDAGVAEGGPYDGGKFIQFTVARTGGIGKPFDVKYSTADGTAKAGSDYTATSGTLHFWDFSTTQTIFIPITSDFVFEPDETFTINLTDATEGAIVTDGQATGTIRNDDIDRPGYIDLTNSGTSIQEGDAGTQEMTFRVKRDYGGAAFSVDYATADGSAQAGSDYAATSGTLNFAVGQMFATVTVLVYGDRLFELDEGFALNFTNPTTGATFFDYKTQAGGRISNDDVSSAGSIKINDVDMTEGNNGTQLATFTVTRTTGDNNGAFSISYSTSGITAASGQDFVASSGVLNFMAGQTTAQIYVPVYGDRTFERDETFSVNLFSATNGVVIADGQGIGTIRNDDDSRNDDFANSLADQGRPFGAVGINASATGTIEAAGDHDWFGVYLQSGQTYVLRQSGSSSGNGSLYDPYLKIFTSAGVLVRGDDNSGPGNDARMTFTPSISGTYYLDAGSSNDRDAGSYRVSVERIPTPDRSGSALINDDYYRTAYSDVAAAGADPDTHYNQWGWREGRNPNAYFSTNAYLALNADVRNDGVNPLEHYQKNGWREGRDPSASFDVEIYLARNPDVAAAGIDPLTHFIEHGQAEGRESHSAIGRASDIGVHPGFDAEYYLLSNPDLAAAALITGGNVNDFAYRHYETFGWKEGRNPNAMFDVAGYLNAYADVKVAGVDPLMHYNQSGWKEGRDPSRNFDTAGYLAANTDVKAAGVDPVLHYLQAGAIEGRTIVDDGVFGR